MPFYVPWLTETIKKRGVRYLLHHYLGQFFEEKLTLEQLSIDIYEGKGSIRNLTLDVDGLNDELDFIPFRFLDGCSIGQISVEVPWSSLATEACRVELDGARFICRLKTSADGIKTHCMESALLSRSLMTSSMQMAEEIITTEDDDEYETPESSTLRRQGFKDNQGTKAKQKDANQMFEGLEMFAQLIDSVLRRTKLTARNTLFQIQAHSDDQKAEVDDEEDHGDDVRCKQQANHASSRSSGDEFSEPLAKSDTDTESEEREESKPSSSKDTVEFFIRFFRCEEMIDQTRVDELDSQANKTNDDSDEDHLKKSLSAMPETITKLLTLEDVEMRIGGIPVSNLIGKHTITIKFNGQKSEISIFSGSPLLAVISHKQLETFFRVFDSPTNVDASRLTSESDQKMMSPEDYAKIENQLLESATFRSVNELGGLNIGGVTGGCVPSVPYYVSSQGGAGGSRRWVDSVETHSNTSRLKEDIDYEHHHQANMSNRNKIIDSKEVEANGLDNIEAFSCELKLPGIWLCILRDGERLPPLIKPYADSINSFQTINKYIDGHIKMPHIRFLALKVALNLTAKGINIFLGDLDISEHLKDDAVLNSKLKLLQNDMTNIPVNTSRYKVSIVNREITIDLLTKTRIVFDPTMIDRIVYDYKLVKLSNQAARANETTATKTRKQPRKQPSNAIPGSSSGKQKSNNLDLNLTIRGERFVVELLCPIPDLTPQASTRQTQLRPQSFLFDFKDINLTWQLDILNLSANELLAYVKTRPKQSDNEAIKFIESSGKNNDRIVLVLEPSPSRLNDGFPSEVDQVLNESSLYDSIYVGQATESRIPTEAFQTKRKVVKASFQHNNKSEGAHTPRLSECDHERILTPGDRQHLLDYLSQTVMSTKLSLNLHLPVCEVEFEDKEQLDLIYNRFGNDFIFWHPQALGGNAADADSTTTTSGNRSSGGRVGRRRSKQRGGQQQASAGARSSRVKQPYSAYLDNSSDETDESDYDEDDDVDSEISYRSSSLKRASGATGGSNSETRYENEITCKILVDELSIRFNHQSCAAALKQEITADNFLLGVVIDVDRKPNTLLSLVADNLELSTDSDTVLEGNSFGNENSIFSLTAQIKRPTKAIKDIKLAIQLRNGLFNDFKTETYTRFWQSINVTDEPIMGYVAPKIVTELHIDILNTALSIIKEGARPALLSIDELYVTSMVMEQTSQVMIRLIADEVSLYMKRNRKGFELMKNYICLVDSGLIDLDVKFSQDGRLEFSVINNVITLRVCQDSLSALCKLFQVLVRNSSNVSNERPESSAQQLDEDQEDNQNIGHGNTDTASTTTNQDEAQFGLPEKNIDNRRREMNLLADAMNDFSIPTTASKDNSFDCANKDESGATTTTTDRYTTAYESDSVDDDNQASESGSDDDDDDKPPILEHRASSAEQAGEQVEDRLSSRRCNPISCLLDESNPMLGDLFSQPLLLPAHDEDQASGYNKSVDNDRLRHGESTSKSKSTTTTSSSSSTTSTSTSLIKNSTEEFGGATSSGAKALGDSGFFVIGDDDVGAGVIDKRQLEPVVRKLIDGPINIVESHFKMTKPRTIPEMLATSLERYVLEEMTLVVNLYGGRDFDEEDPAEAESSSSSSTTKAKSQLSDAADHDTELLDSTSVESLSVASGSRTGSVGGGGGSGAIQTSASSTLTSGSKRIGLSASNTSSLKRRGGGRRKHLSEGSGKDFTDIGGPGSGKSDRHSLMEPRSVRFGEGAVNLWESLDLMSAPDFLGTGRPRLSQPSLNSDLKKAGGTWRRTDVCIQLTLSKVKLLYELADAASVLEAAADNAAPTRAGLSGQSAREASAKSAHSSAAAAPISWRFMLFIQDIEVKDRVAASDINKMLYEYCTETMPKRSTQFLTIKNVATINPSDNCEECDLRVSLKPLRLNVDQDTLLFLIEFFTALTKSLAKQQQQQQQSALYANNKSLAKNNCADSSGRARTRLGSCSSNKSAKLVDGGATRVSDGNKYAHQQQEPNDTSSLSTSASSATSSSLSAAKCNRKVIARGNEQDNGRPSNAAAATTTTTTITRARLDSGAEADGSPLPTHCHSDSVGGSINQQPIYIKSFTFSPDVPIRLDYHAKHLDFEQGALAGILMGLAHLDHSELILKRVQANHGMRGLDRVLLFAMNSWTGDIKRNQLPSILRGVGPMHSVIQLFQGMRDLIWMPIDHYRKDKRLVRGLQRGASSFSSSTAMAAINLVNRFISIVQCTAQIAHDIVTPPIVAPGHHHHHHRHAGSTKSLGAGLGGGQSASGQPRHHHHHHHHGQTGAGGCGAGQAACSAAAPGPVGLNQPRNFCEGVAVGFNIIKEGFNDTARNVTVGMQAEDMRSAVGELVRQIPSTLLNPIISATEGAQSVLVGIRNQIAPEARREDQEKWKRRVRGK